MFNKSRSYLVPTVFAPSDVGVFSIYPRDDDSYFGSYWDTCREQFAKKFLEDSYGFFISVDDNKQGLVDFIEQCEKLLSLKSKSVFYETDMKNVIFIIPSEFWMPCYMKRSLLTLLCRNGIFYDGSNFERFLFGEVENFKKEKIDNCLQFARKTKLAMMRFFAGYNSYVGLGPNMEEIFPEKHGWVVEFTNKTADYIKKVLICRESHAYSVRLFGRSIFLD
jgi:hypothetical protein